MARPLRALVACETSGAVRQALADQWGGHAETATTTQEGTAE